MLNDRFDKLLEMIQHDLNRWKCEAGHYKVKLDQISKKLEKCQQESLMRSESLIFSQRHSIASPSEHSEHDKIELKSEMIEDENSSIRCSPEVKTSENKSEPQVDLMNPNDYSIECPVCKMRFNTIYEYNIHLLSEHTSNDFLHAVNNNKGRRIKRQKIFKCSWNGCKKSFFRRYELKRHSFTHEPKSNRYQYICDAPFCHKKYMSSTHLKEHKLMKHKSSAGKILIVAQQVEPIPDEYQNDAITMSVANLSDEYKSCKFNLTNKHIALLDHRYSL